MFLKDLLRNNHFVMKLYFKWKKKHIERNRKSSVKGKFVLKNYSIGKENCDNLVIIIAGYKPFLYSYTFERFKLFIPESNYNVVISSSGLWSDALDDIAKKNHWSYLSSKKNDVSLIQNLTIAAFPKAKYIFKFDEDIFITKNTIEEMQNTFQQASLDKSLRIGFVTPVLNVNGYGYIRILKKLGKEENFKNKFGFWPTYEIYGDHDIPIEKDYKVSQFMWGEDGTVPQIDVLSDFFANNNYGYSLCPFAYSIGAIMFTREFWELLGHFPVSKGSFGNLAADERFLCHFCQFEAYAIVVCESTIVGHFGYGAQTFNMKNVLEDRPDLFSLNDTEKERYE
jgi:hypothetical protein